MTLIEMLRESGFAHEVEAADRIAELERVARMALDALENHDGNYKLSKAAGKVVDDALTELRRVLGETK